MKTYKTLLILLIFLPVLAAADRPPPTEDPSAADNPGGMEIDPYAAGGRLAIPTLTANPAQVELGSKVYYYNCMPCHGDRGQGLTDEFRSLWVEDHQNCWARGCHGGNGPNEGFPLPRSIPAVVYPESAQRFPTAQNLFDYLKATHPPQRPGALQEDEYWAVSAFVLHLNGRLPEDGTVGAAAKAALAPWLGGALIFGGGLGSLILFKAKRSRGKS